MTHYKQPYANNTICGEAAADADVTPFVEHVDCPACLRQLIAAAQRDAAPTPPAPAPVAPQIINRIEQAPPAAAPQENDPVATILFIIGCAILGYWLAVSL